MKAAVLYGREDVRVEEIEPRPLQEGEVRISIQAALTCGTDLKVFKRGYHAKMIVPPAVFGHELSGVLSEIHPSVRGWNIGDRVVVANSAPCGRCFLCQQGQENLCDDLIFLNGAYAASIVVPARIVQKNMLGLKSGTDFRDAALVEPLACVVQGFEDLQIQPSQAVLIIGSGPIGLMFLRLAKATYCRVTLAGRGKRRLEKAIQLGADEVIDVSGAVDLVERIRTLSSPNFDVVFEAVGKPETWEASVALARKGGKVNFFGGCPSGTSIHLDTGRLHYSSLTLLASFHHTPRTIRRALELIEQGTIRAADFVDGECPLSKLPEFFQNLLQGNRAIKTFVHVQA